MHYTNSGGKHDIRLHPRFKRQANGRKYTVPQNLPRARQDITLCAAQSLSAHGRGKIIHWKIRGKSLVCENFTIFLQMDYSKICGVR